MISRRKTLTALWDVWRAGREGAQGVLARQQDRLQSLIAYSRTHSRLYKNLYRHLPTEINQLTDLPPVTKPELMAHFDEWVTDPHVHYDALKAYIADPALIGVPYLGRYTVWRTSGTTGSPGVFLHDGDALAIYTALLLLRGYLSWISTPGEWWRLIRRRWRASFIYATNGHFAGITFATLVNKLRSGSSQLPAGISAHLPLPDLVNTLNATNPPILSTYPSIVEMLMSEQASGRLKIKPDLIATGGEGLKALVKEQAANIFHCKVVDTYAASEFMGIAFSCACGRLHLNSDWVILEPVDADCHPIEPGNPPHSVLLTNLANRIQPTIRYQLGDSVSFYPDPCPCGSPLPTISVEGRNDEILAFESPTGTQVNIPPLPLELIVMVIAGVKRFQLIQTGARTLKVRLETQCDADSTQVWQVVLDRLREYFDSQGLASVALERSSEPPLQHAVSAKLRHVYSEWRTIHHDLNAGVPAL
ncbi:MAG: AMP-binding protein [Anaerolineae bacterium]